MAVLSVGIGAAREPLASLVRRAADRPLALLFAVNLLNLADAVLSEFWLRSGEALEANPVVRAIGLPAKILLVGGASVALLRLRPRALIWPMLTLVGALAYHVAGVVIRT